MQENYERFPTLGQDHFCRLMAAIKRQTAAAAAAATAAVAHSTKSNQLPMRTQRR